MKSKLLFVTSRNFGGGISFVKRGDAWIVEFIPPYLKKVLAGVPIGSIGGVLTSKGFRHEWV